MVIQSDPPFDAQTLKYLIVIYLKNSGDPTDPN